MLLSFGADAICPYIVFESLKRLRVEGMLTPVGSDPSKSTDEAFFNNYAMAVERGILKVRCFRIVFDAVYRHKRPQMILVNVFTGDYED